MFELLPASMLNPGGIFVLAPDVVVRVCESFVDIRGKGIHHSSFMLAAMSTKTRSIFTKP